jgi:hypothetical protein
LLLLITLAFVQPLGAQQNFTQGYNSDQSIQKGMIVRLKKEDTTKVELVSTDSADQMHGVVVDSNDAPVTLSAEGQKIFVANGGHFDVLVSDQNGAVAPGDFLTISAIDGIGMKAGTKEPVVIGRALKGFSGRDNIISTTEVKDTKGASVKVNLGYVEADISVGRNPLLKSKDPNLPTFLKKAIEEVAGRQVSATRAYIAVFVFLASCLVAGALLYSGVRSGLVSLGRNPLSRKSIIRGMLQVVLIALIVFISGVFGVYLILKL